jgi:hypothetical protein
VEDCCCGFGVIVCGSLLVRVPFVQPPTLRVTARQGSRKFSSFCPHFSLDFSLHFQRECFSSRKSRAQPARPGSLLLGLPPLRQIFLEQRRRGRLGPHHDARDSPAAGFFDRLNAVDAARDLLAVAVQHVAAP